MQPNQLFRKYLKNSLLAAGFVLLISAVFTGARFADSHIRVKYIRILGISAKHPFFGIENLKGARMITLDERDVEKHLLEANPHAKTIRVARAYPDTISVAVTLAKPFAYFEGKGGFFVIDNNGKVIAKQKKATLPDNLPLIRYFQKFDYSSITPGSEFSARDIAMTLRFITKMQDMGERVITVDIDGVDVIGLNLNSKAIVFSSEKDVEPQIYQLEQIMRQFRIQGKDFKKLDLRYNRPILELAD